MLATIDEKMKWFYMAGPGGTIAIKAEYAVKAKREAAERWGCGADEITVTGEEAYNTESGQGACTTGRQVVGAT